MVQLSHQRFCTFLDLHRRGHHITIHMSARVDGRSKLTLSADAKPTAMLCDAVTDAMLRQLEHLFTDAAYAVFDKGHTHTSSGAITSSFYFMKVRTSAGPVVGVDSIYLPGHGQPAWQPRPRTKQRMSMSASIPSGRVQPLVDQLGFSGHWCALPFSERVRLSSVELSTVSALPAFGDGASAPEFQQVSHSTPEDELSSASASHEAWSQTEGQFDDVIQFVETHTRVQRQCDEYMEQMATMKEALLALQARLQPT
eukprot:TRINITY_DN48347_c1_g1_i14.p1 TRINITY_DN48347_c1_g1~~TRINITY_DN48347_c1_g1_i14.p1  ORF type:complete len:289 (+),score=20.34 TRINITY_DN48347_c1_g1_i14:105-869(+)